jgi:hypothetical protein
MRRLPITVFIVILSLVFAVTGWKLFARNEVARFHAVDAVRESKSYIELTLRIVYPTGSIASEEYRLTNDNGRSRATYAVANRGGTVATFDEIIRGYDVTFAFDKLVRDGIWELDSKHPRAPSDARYTVTIAQTAQSQSGHRTFTFSNPQYWAVAAGREYHIRLEPNKPVPSQADLLHLDSSSLAEPRYVKIIDDFRSFGSPGFQRTVVAARAKLHGS